MIGSFRHQGLKMSGRRPGRGDSDTATRLFGLAAATRVERLTDTADVVACRECADLFAEPLGRRLGRERLIDARSQREHVALFRKVLKRTGETLRQLERI